MNKMSVLKISLAIAFVFVLNSCQKTQLIKGHTDIIPFPQEIITTEGFFEINSKTEISVQNEDQKKIAQQLIADLKRASGWELKLGKKESGSIVFKEDPALNEEAYTLSVTPGQILISASSAAGYFYGMQTLKQMLPAQFFAKEQLTEVAWGIPSVEIKDEPAFEWRGYMLDVSRHFFDVSSVKKVFDFKLTTYFYIVESAEKPNQLLKVIFSCPWIIGENRFIIYRNTLWITSAIQ